MKEALNNIMLSSVLILILFTLMAVVYSSFSGYCFSRGLYLTERDYCVPFMKKMKERMVHRNENPEAVRSCYVTNPDSSVVSVNIVIDNSKMIDPIDSGVVTHLCDTCGRDLGNFL